MVTTPDGPATRVALAPGQAVLLSAAGCRGIPAAARPCSRIHRSFRAPPGQRLGADPPCTLDRLLRLRLGPTGGSLSLGDSSGPSGSACSAVAWRWMSAASTLKAQTGLFGRTRDNPSQQNVPPKGGIQGYRAVTRPRRDSA